MEAPGMMVPPRFLAAIAAGGGPADATGDGGRRLRPDAWANPIVRF